MTDERLAGRRALLLAAPLTGLAWRTLPATATSGSEPVKVRLDLAPDQSRYNAADGRLRDAAAKLQLALNAEDVKVLLRNHACSATWLCSTLVALPASWHP